METKGAGGKKGKGNITVPTEAAVKDAYSKARASASADKVSSRKPRSDEEKAAAEAEKVAARERRNAERAQRKLDRERDRKPAHMRKVANAALRLPALAHDARVLLESLLVHPAATIQSLIAHAEHELRARLTARSLDVKLKEKDLVRILSGDLKHIGQLARVTEVRRIRCHVQPLGTTKQVYLLNSDVEVVDEAESVATTTAAAPIDEAPDAKSA